LTRPVGLTCAIAGKRLELVTPVRFCAGGVNDNDASVVLRQVGQQGDTTMKASLRPGVSRVNRFVVNRERTISFMGDEARTYATPSMILDIEHTCRELILEHADAGEDSVGMEVAIKHLAPTLMGMTVEITVSAVAVEGPQGDVRGRRQGRA